MVLWNTRRMRSFLEVGRYESGVPMETAWDRLVRRAQPVLTVAFAVLDIAFIRPMAVVDGATWAGALRLFLVLGCMALMLTVTVPDRIIPAAYRVWIATTAAVLAGLLMGLQGQGWSATFAYMVATHSGFRYPARTAFRIVGLCVVVAVAASQLPEATATTPWWTNLLVFAAMLPGMTRRTRMLTLAAANEAIQQGRRAAASEAQSRAMAERASIARDIHDVLAHSLSGVNMQLSLADALLDSGDETAGRDAIRTAQRLVVEGLQEARSAVQTLRGDTIDPVDALSSMVVGADENLAIVGAPHHLPSRVVHTVIRVAQESLTNARRHAPGARVDMELAFGASSTRLTVTNASADVALEPGSSEGSGLGLVGIRERVEQVGGTTEIGPDGPGWRVCVDIPVQGSGIDD